MLLRGCDMLKPQCTHVGFAILLPMATGTRAASLAEVSPAALIREARTRAGLSQAALAERAGTTQSAVSRWEGGHEEPRLRRLGEILEACGVLPTLTVTGLDDVVDRTQLRQQLAMSPEQRLASVANVSRLRAKAKRA